jgi:hypothetical protein
MIRRCRGRTTGCNRDGSHAGGRSRSIKFHNSPNDQNLLHQSEAIISRHEPIIQRASSPMTSQHQRDNSEGQRGDDRELPKASQTTGKHGASLGIDGANSPTVCSGSWVTRGVPLGALEVCRSSPHETVDSAATTTMVPRMVSKGDEIKFRVAVVLLGALSIVLSVIAVFMD